jgi:hypothetical protein
MSGSDGLIEQIWVDTETDTPREVYHLVSKDEAAVLWSQIASKDISLVQIPERLVPAYTFRLMDGEGRVTFLHAFAPINRSDLEAPDGMKITKWRFFAQDVAPNLPSLTTTEKAALRPLTIGYDDQLSLIQIPLRSSSQNPYSVNVDWRISSSELLVPSKGAPMAEYRGMPDFWIPSLGAAPPVALLGVSTLDTVGPLDLETPTNVHFRNPAYRKGYSCVPLITNWR